MTNAEEFIENFLKHGLSPEDVKRYNREYYLRNRKLKGRKISSATKAKAPRKMIQEDELPETSPSGAKLVDFDGKDGGRATYSDGSTFDGNGWNSDRSSPRVRLSVAQGKLNQAKSLVNKIQDPTFKAQRIQQLERLQQELDAAKRKQFPRMKSKVGSKPTRNRSARLSGNRAAS